MLSKRPTAKLPRRPASSFGMTRPKLIRTLAFVVAMFALISVAGHFWILQSEPYELGRAALASGLNVDPERIELKRLASFRFADGAFSGEALFVLCAPQERCFTVVAKKRDARWSVADLVER
ncbi:hypothetical protein [Polaromonas sp. CF318]|uniref:hypothetical protein n=1 Tax=Polaromonas sp. CF318 TaxID=1144318 RepID=UPI0012F723A3|nr:hypothetical protein [Polaromonas sp. CF318]